MGMWTRRTRHASSKHPLRPHAPDQAAPQRGLRVKTALGQRDTHLSNTDPDKVPSWGQAELTNRAALHKVTFSVTLKTNDGDIVHLKEQQKKQGTK